MIGSEALAWLAVDGLIGLIGGVLVSLRLDEITRRDRWLTLAASIAVPATMAPGVTAVMGWPNAAQIMLAMVLGIGGRSMVLLLGQPEQLVGFLRLIVMRR